MKKRGVLKWIMFLPVFGLVLRGCGGEETENPWLPELLPSIGAKGGTAVGFDGDVVLTIPPGALVEDVRFVIKELPLKSASGGCDLLKTFIIEPSVTFKVPANLKVYVNGCLSNGKTVCEEAEVFFRISDNLTVYCSDSRQCWITCCYETWSQSLSACIDRTGVIATIGETQ